MVLYFPSLSLLKMNGLSADVDKNCGNLGPSFILVSFIDLLLFFLSSICILFFYDCFFILRVSLYCYNLF